MTARNYLKLLSFSALAGLPLALVSSAADAGEAIPLPRPRPHLSAPAIVLPAPVRAALMPVPLPRQKPQAGAHMLEMPAPAVTASLHPTTLRGPLPATFQRSPMAFVPAPTAATSEADRNAVKQVIELARKGRDADADAVKNSIEDPLARKLAEYLFLRSDGTNPSFERYASFINANPTWPHIPMLRRRAENALWDDKLDNSAVLSFFAVQQPTTAKGRFVLARAMLAQGNRAGAEMLVREAWRHGEFSSTIENAVADQFKDMLTLADYRARMNVRLFDGDTEAGMRIAQRLGGGDLAIARAFAAMNSRAKDLRPYLEAVPLASRSEPGYIFLRAQWLRKQDKIAEAAQLMLSAPRDAASAYDPDQWWIERRLLLRKLLDNNDAKTAYLIARDSAVPSKENYRADRHFTAGWIALRFLHDPALAMGHFNHVADNTINPHALSRAGYWQGRAAEAMHKKAEANTFYQHAAQFTATYYGQLARGRLGLADVGLRGAPVFSPEERTALSRLEIVRAVEILYALGERDLVASILAELGERATDVAGMAALGELAARHGDGRAMVHLGKGAYGRGLPLEYYAYPVVGLPNYTPVAPPIETAVAYSIARQESHFNQKVVSSAQAMGLMQVTPAAGIDTAKKYKVAYDRGRLLKDPVYNMQMGAAELSNLIDQYRGSYIMTFAGYNAGRGRVKQWVEAHGDPRDPKIDPVDWVELIPIAETRNYVQRIMENLTVYRVRFGGGSKLLIEADIRRGTEAN